MTKAASSVDVRLTFPIELEGNAAISKLTISRPKTANVLELIKLFGKDIVTILLSGDGDRMQDKVAALKSGDSELVGRIASLLDAHKLDALAAALAKLFGVTPEQFLLIDPADYPAIGRALADFFPALETLTQAPCSSGQAT